MGKFKMRFGTFSGVAVILALSGVSHVNAQMPTYGVGRAPTPQEARAWDISIGPEGKELPPGKGTAEQGAPLYAQKCAVCHGPTGKEVVPGGPRVPLVGGDGTFTTPHPVRSAGRYWAFATTIWDVINRGMPRGQEGTLKPDEVYSLTALILYWNGILKEDEELHRERLPKINMPNRDGFVPTKLEDINRLRCQTGTCP